MTCTLVTRLPGIKAPSPMSGSSPASTAQRAALAVSGGAGKGGQRHCGQCHAQRQNHADEPFLHKILSFSSALQAGRFCCTQCTTFCPLWTVLGTNRPANALKRPGAPHAPAKNRKPPGLRLPDGFLLYRNYGNGILNRALLCACSIPRTAAKMEQFCVNGP